MIFAMSGNGYKILGTLIIMGLLKKVNHRKEEDPIISDFLEGEPFMI